MCNLCDKIYRCTESAPYLTNHIQLDPEGVFQLMIHWFDIASDTEGWLSTGINFCPECGSDMYVQGITTLNKSRQKLPTPPTPPPPIRVIHNGAPK